MRWGGETKAECVVKGVFLRLDEEKSGPASRLWIVRKDF